MNEFLNTLKKGLACKCPRCEIGNLYPKSFDLDVKGHCSHCGLDFGKNDSADGPAVFLIFILSFSIVPLALLVDALFSIPYWMHLLVWTLLCIGITLASLKYLKSYIIYLQYKHRPTDWDDKE